MKNFLSIHDIEDLPKLIAKARQIKADPYARRELGRNKSVGLIFLNPSLRTRMSSQRAAQNLGMDSVVLDIKDAWGLELADGSVMDGPAGEHIKEAAAVWSEYFDIIGIRSFAELKDRDLDYSEPVLSRLQKYMDIPIVNLESATRHPCQSFADVITIDELKKVKRPKVVLTWAPHVKALPQAVANSFAEWVSRTDCELVITHPKGYELAPEFSMNATVTYDQEAAFKNADFVYAKNWASYETYGQIINRDSSWMVTPDKMAKTNDAYFMHCLPVRRNLVVHEDVLDSKNCKIRQQAANRIVAAQAVLQTLLEEGL
jgi:N-succinyl-L-ornithine transcarbamylase